MLDNQLFTLLIAIIEAAEPGAGIPNVAGQPGVPVYQSYQPQQQGVPTGPAAFLHIINHHRYGYPEKTDRWEPPVPPAEDGRMIHRETQILETMFQLDALATQDPNAPNQYTASDIVKLMSYIMQSDETLRQLRAAGVGIERITDVRNPQLVDDRDRFEASPSFDFVLTHKLIVESDVPVLQSEEFRFRSV